MPKVDYPAAPSAGTAALSVAQVRILQVLAASMGVSRGKLEARAGGATDLEVLQKAGLVAPVALDIDGAAEKAWCITGAGEARLAAVAPAALPEDGAKGRPGRFEQPRIGAVVPWFGSSRRYASAVGEQFKGISWVGVPFCGGLSEIPSILAAGVNAMALNDKHGHLINLMRVMASPEAGPRLYRQLRRAPFCASILKSAQDYCDAHPLRRPASPDYPPDYQAAVSYFISAWMARSAEAGKDGEFKAGLAIRYGAGGGNSAVRFQNAVFSIRAWRTILGRCSVSCDDAFDFLARCNDREDGGIYSDPPWLVVGDAYKIKFSEPEQVRLAEALVGFKKARVVIRTGGGKLIERLYPRSKWKWLEVAGRDQANSVKVEYLLRRN
jgi:hypothetical protein